MNKILFAAIIILMFPFTGFGQSDKWVSYTSYEGHYTINFPAAPNESVERDTASGVITTIHFADYEINDSTLFMCGWIDLTNQLDTVTDIKQTLENSRDGATSSMKTTEVNTLAINLEDEPYIEFTFKGEDFAGKDRIYIINKFQYSLISMFPLRKENLPDADKFIHSFKHLL